MDTLRSIFAPKPLTAAEQIRKSRLELRSQERLIQRGILKAEHEKQDSIREARALKRRGDLTNARTVARGIITFNREIARMHANKAHINSLTLVLQSVKMTRTVCLAVADASAIIKSLNALMRVPDLAQMAKVMHQGLYASEIINEKLEDILSGSDDDEEDKVDEILEEITDAEITKLLDGLSLVDNREAPRQREVAVDRHQVKRVRQPAAAVPDASAVSIGGNM